MRQWRKDGLPVDDEDLAALGQTDTVALIEYAGTMFRFTAETIAGHHSRQGQRSGGTVVLALRELGVADSDRAIYLVDFADAGPFEDIHCDSECASLAQAGETAYRAARRYVGVELFHRAQELIGPGQVA
jgi:hypothetical protein